MTYPQAPSNVELVFEQSIASSPTGVQLTFGATAIGPAPGDTFDAVFNARFSLRGTVGVNYDSAVFRGLSSTTTFIHDNGAAREAITVSNWQPPVKGVVDVAGAFDEAAPVAVGVTTQWQPPVSAHQEADLVWGATTGAVARETASAWFVPSSTLRDTTARWQESVIVEEVLTSVFGLGLAAHRDTASRWQQGLHTDIAKTASMNRAAKPVTLGVSAPWQRALVLSTYGGPRYLPLPPSVVPPHPDTVVDLRFCALYADNRTTLVFGLNPCGSVTPDSQLYILPARFYMAVHNITATTFPGLTPIRITDVSLAADVDSTVWTFSARGPVELFDQLVPTAGMPAQIAVNIDGLEWVFIVDKLQLEEKFGARGASIAGRSVTAAIGQPYARETSRLSTTARNAQQLAADALNLSGVGLDWGIDDWLVPAGAWSNTGTPLAAVQAIAQAAGGFVNSHRSDPTVLVRHPYPTLPGGIPGGPWNWNGAFAADVELAPDAILSTSFERVDGPDIDGVYVSGANQGVLAHVFRDSTIGAKLAAMETDPLITATAAARQRGLSVLGKAGAKHMVQMTIPVLTGGSNPGVLDVGQLVQINETVPWRGRVRSVSVQANMRQVRQSFSLERHLA